MSADTLATGSLNSFPGLPTGQESPSDQIYVLTSSELQGIISRAVAWAIKPLEARLQDLEDEVRGRGAGGGEEALKARVGALEEATARERAYDRQRLARLERVDPQPLQKDRGEILRALIAANGGKMLAKEARKKMHLSRSRFSELLTTMKGEIEVKPFHLKKSQNVLILI